MITTILALEKTDSQEEQSSSFVDSFAFILFVRRLIHLIACYCVLLLGQAKECLRRRHCHDKFIYPFIILTIILKRHLRVYGLPYRNANQVLLNVIFIFQSKHNANFLVIRSLAWLHFSSFSRTESHIFFNFCFSEKFVYQSSLMRWKTWTLPWILQELKANYARVCGQHWRLFDSSFNEIFVFCGWWLSNQFNIIRWRYFLAAIPMAVICS